MAEIKIEIKNLPQIRSAFSKAPKNMSVNLSNAIRDTVLYIEGVSNSKVPVRTANLKGSAYTKWGGLAGEIGYLATYAVYVHEGTGLYGPNKTLIRPAHGKVLATKTNPGFGVKTKKGYYIIGRWSRGQKANPFLKNAVEKSQDKIDKFFNDAVNKTLKEIADEVNG